MKEVERAKAQKIVDKIQSGSFDENDIDNLLIRLRAYSFDQSAFREIAHFVAHSDERDRGITNQALEAFYLSIQYFLEYVSPKIGLNISKPFPLYVKRLMKYQVDKSDERVLRESFNVTKKQLKTRIDKLFKEDKSNRTACLYRPTISYHTFEAIRHILSFIGAVPAFTQTELLEQLIVVLTKNKIKFSRDLLMEQAPKVTLCILLLFHDAIFNFGGYKPGYCKISCENTTSYHISVVDSAGSRIEQVQEFGSLQILGHVILKKDNGEVTVCFPIMSTNLRADDWCDETLFLVKSSGGQSPGYACKQLLFESPLSLSKDFKLCRLDPQDPNETIQSTRYTCS